MVEPAFKNIYEMILGNEFVTRLFGGELFTENLILARVLFAILLFTILYAAISLVFPKKYGEDTTKGVKIVIPLVMSIITVSVIPTRLLEAISYTWGVVFVFLLIAPIILGGAYVLFTNKVIDSSKNRFMKIIKALIAFLLWYITGIFATAEATLVGFAGAVNQIGTQTFGGITSFMSYASAAFLLIGIYFLISAFVVGVATSKVGRAAGHAAFSGLKGIWEKFKDTFKKETEIVANAEAVEKKVETDSIDDIETDMGILEEKEKELEKIGEEAEKQASTKEEKKIIKSTTEKNKEKIKHAKKKIVKKLDDSSKRVEKFKKELMVLSNVLATGIREKYNEVEKATNNFVIIGGGVTKYFIGARSIAAGSFAELNKSADDLSNKLKSLKRSLSSVIERRNAYRMVFQFKELSNFKGDEKISVWSKEYFRSLDLVKRKKIPGILDLLSKIINQTKKPLPLEKQGEFVNELQSILVDINQNIWQNPKQSIKAWLFKEKSETLYNLENSLNNLMSIIDPLDKKTQQLLNLARAREKK